MRFQPAKPSIYGETLETLQQRLTSLGQPAFRAKQIMDWLYRHQVSEFGAMSNLPVNLRSLLEETYCIQPSSRVMVKKASDVTEKLLLEQEDRALIETVLISYPQKGVGQEDSRTTICVSSQVGCAYGCKFCASGLAGWKRDLSAAEIVAQYMHIINLEKERTGRTEPAVNVPFDNVVYMGMGEPLANIDNLIQSIRILNADWGLKFGARRITVSTSGLVPEIMRLADEPIQFRLAISLHGATNEVRQQIMPINRKYPLEKLLPAASYFSSKHGRMLTLEFILIEGVNDTFEQAHALADIARDLHAHVNLIPYNVVEGLEWIRPSLTRQRAFGKILEEADISFTIRKEKGHDIDAACGQLRLRTENERAGSVG